MPTDGSSAKDGSMRNGVYPDPGILLYTRIKKSPYLLRARRHGVKLYSTYNHHYHPRLYGDPIDSTGSCWKASLCGMSVARSVKSR